MGFRRKKASIGIAFFTGLVVVLVFGIVMIAVLKFGVSKTDQPRADAICEASVAIRGKAVVQALGNQVHLTPLLCKANNKIEINAKGKTNKQVLTEIMNHAVKAWGIFGEGKYAALSNIYFGGLSNSDSCFPYYAVTIRNLKKPIDSFEIQRFIEENYVKNTNQTYYQYFSHPQNGIVIYTDKIETEHIYSIVFGNIRMGEFGILWDERTPYNLMIIAPLGEDIILSREKGWKFGKWTGINIPIPFTGGEVKCYFVHGVQT